MNVKLPERIDRQAPPLLDQARQITVIGANGSGKSRFCDWLMSHSSASNRPVHRLSALKASFDSPSEPALPGSINDLFNRLNMGQAMVKRTSGTEFDRLVFLMLDDEFRSLMNYKTHLLMGEEPDFPKTKLDATVRAWQQVFPKNKILRENGKLLFATEGQDDSYSSLRLSDGERTTLYYIGAVLYAQKNALVLIDDPETFIHPSMMHTLWNQIEAMRPDLTMVYNTHDVSFAASRTDAACVWVKAFDPAAQAWDYEVMQAGSGLSDGLYLDLLGSRKPVLFIEGDERHSIDFRLYTLVFPEFQVKPLGSCNKVIESVRTFGDLRTFHQMESWGIVDRDRRSDREVEYLRKKHILVPGVAEIENILMLEGVIRAVADYRGRNGDQVFGKVKRSVVRMFGRQLEEQALQHVRHRVKMDVELRVDKRFDSIEQLEEHMVDLVNEINPRGRYNKLCTQFHAYYASSDYAQILRVFNQKLMLVDSNVAGLMGLQGKDAYVKTVLHILKSNAPQAAAIRKAVKQCFGLED